LVDFLLKPPELLTASGALSTWQLMAKRCGEPSLWGKRKGSTRLSVYLPQQGVVLAQMNVEHKGSEITFAPTLLRQIDLRGVVGSLDAMFDRRSLSLKIVQAHGDYLWTVKENEKGFYQDIEVLFQPHRKRAGTSAPPNDFRRAREQWRKDTGASKSERSP